MLLMLLQEEEDSYGHSGFNLSEEWLSQGFYPNTLMLLIAYMFLATALMLYIVFGLSFLNQSRSIEDSTSNVGQKSYYRGLGLFIISVAASQCLTLIDIISMDVKDVPFFRTSGKYEPPFESMIGGDDYVVGFTMVLLALTFLVYPLEKYLLSRKPMLTVVVSVAVPMPLVLRLIEINHQIFGLELAADSFDKLIFTFLWIFVVAVVILSILFVMKLYAELGFKSPAGSILRQRSRMVIFGLTIWVVCVFLTSEIHFEISDITSPYNFQYTGSLNPIAEFVHEYKLYYLFPLIVPGLLYIALTYLVFGFKRDF